MRTKLLTLLAFSALAVHATPARAGDAPGRDQCFDAHEKFQVHQKDAKLRDALRELEICSNAACPKLVRSECTTSLAELQKAVPTVVLSLRRADGSSVDGARVSIDGGPAEPLPSTPVTLDPGAHVFRFEAPDGASVEVRSILITGQKDVSVKGELAGAPPPQPVPGPSPVEPQANVKQGPSPAVYVLGGVAVLGLGGFVAFGLAGRAKESELDDCKPDCQRSDVDDMRRKYLIADVALGVALVAGGVGAYLYFSRNKTKESAAYLGARPLRSGGAVSLGAAF